MSDYYLNDQQRDDLEVMRGAFGLPLAMLTQEEKLAFDRLIDGGLARPAYPGTLGLLGLAKAERVIPAYYPSFTRSPAQ